MVTGEEHTVYESPGPGGYGWGLDGVFAVLELDTVRRRPVRRWGRWLAGLAAVGLLAGGWWLLAGSDEELAGEASSVDMGLPPEDTVWLVAGESSRQLYRMAGDGSGFAQVTDLPGGFDISEITAGSGRVVVSAALAGHDQIYEVIDGELEPLVEGRVFTPLLSDDGRLAYQRMLDPEHPATSSMAIIVRDLGTGEERTVYESPGPGGYGWGPDGVFASLELNPATYTGQRVTLVDPDGSRRAVDVGEPEVAGLRWQRHAEQLLLALRGQYWMFDVDSGQRRRLPSEWQPVTWSPDGRALLVAEGRRLLLVDPADVTVIREVGRLPIPARNGAWVAGPSRRADPPVPQQNRRRRS